MNLVVHNVRQGFATNSSSTHSIIYNSQPYVKDEYDPGDSFGWQNFTLKSKEMKNLYLLSMLMDNMKLPDFAAKIIAQQWTGCLGRNEGIDHQSLINLPYEYGTDFLSYDFFKEFQEFILSPGIIICGGNDNGEESHPLWDEETEIKIPLRYDDLKSKFYCRKDPLYDFWTIFNPTNGNKVRLSFENNNISRNIVRSSSPELVDLKITQKCFYDCAFCYQGSTPEGTHANIDDIYAIIETLRENKVFEVALGGGEPTIHPDFLRILYSLKRKNITVNFTTRSLTWMKDKDLRDQILPQIGSFAYSVTNEKYVRALGALTEQYFMHGITPVIHVVVGTISNYELKSILKTSQIYGFSVTLLGFKTTGRGVDFKQQSNNWMSVVKSLLETGDCPKLGIDTCLAQQYEQELKEEKIPEYAYTLHEGAFSCYIDAVEMTMGPSSFCSPEEMKPIGIKSTGKWGQNISKDITEKFKYFYHQMGFNENNNMISSSSL